MVLELLYQLIVPFYIYAYNNIIINNRVSKEVKMPEIDDYMSIIKDLRDLWKRHIQWVRAVIIGILDNHDGTESVISSLPRIPENLGNILRPYYGAEIADYLTLIFTEHNKFLINLINAVKKGDVSEAQEQRRKWYQSYHVNLKFREGTKQIRLVPFSVCLRLHFILQSLSLIILYL